MYEQRTKDWRELCEAVATELDPVRLSELISELTRALDQRNLKRNPTIPTIENPTDTNRLAGCWH